MKLLIDIVSDYGSITYASSELDANGMPAVSVVDQVPSLWGTTSNTIHTIRGTLAFIDSNEYLCPIDSFVIIPKKLPIGTLVTVRLYQDYPTTAVATYVVTTTQANETIKIFDIPTELANYWEIEFKLPTSDYILISRVMFGQSWEPTYGITGLIDISKEGFLKGDRYRNGGTFVAPSVNYTTQQLEFAEISQEVCYTLLDSLSRYGSGATVVVHDLVDNSTLTSSSIYGRVKEWGNPKKSVSQAYSISLTIEEILQ